MCKIKQLNGEAPRANNYCTAREYEVLTIIAKNEELKVGDLIDGEQLSNKTAGRIWEITECNRTDGGHVTIKDNKGNVKTCMFVFGKGTQKPQPKPQPQQTTKEEETKTSETTNNNDKTMNTQGNNTGIEQVANIFASLQNEAYNNGYKVATEEAAAQVAELTARVEELKNQPKGTGNVINITIDGNTTKTEIKGILNPKFETIVTFLSVGEHVYLYGPAGSGKNVLCEQVAKALNAEFFYLNTLYTKYDITGFMDATGKFIETVAYKFLMSAKCVLMLD